MPRCADLGWGATFLLTGLRAKADALGDIFRGVRIMHESSAFALYEAKGRVEEIHRVLLLQGGDRFGGCESSAPKR